ncbi:unnamed protein product [Menidia menidia]|uniref:(Atlantic silverside) hypothetical protein n=1 Tax=Menidia menidia TaxID=238744 RepID=A0A8S4ASL7_9TELE|nr:unnamed protein product [Menidia menidia]
MTKILTRVITHGQRSVLVALCVPSDCLFFCLFFCLDLSSWISSWLPSWCPTSPSQLKDAEEKMLKRSRDSPVGSPGWMRLPWRCSLRSSLLPLLAGCSLTERGAAERRGSYAACRAKPPRHADRGGAGGREGPNGSRRGPNPPAVCTRMVSPGSTSSDWTTRFLLHQNVLLL